MTQLIAPGVYIEEIEPASRTITGVPTSTAAFVGPAARGPSTPVRIASFEDYVRLFGGLHPSSPVSHAVRHFYLNGGGLAQIVRVTHDSGGGTLAAESVASIGAQWGELVATPEAMAISGFDHLRAVIAGGTGTTIDLELSLRNATGSVLTDGANDYLVNLAGLDLSVDPSAALAAALTSTTNGTAVPIALATWNPGGTPFANAPPDGTYDSRLRDDEQVITLFAPFASGLEVRLTAAAQAVSGADHLSVTSTFVRGTTVSLRIELRDNADALITGTGGDYSATINVDLAGNIPAALAGGLSSATPQIQLIEVVGTPVRTLPVDGTYAGTAPGDTVRLSGAPFLQLEAANAGAWADRLRVSFDTLDAVAGHFHLRVQELGDDGRIVASEGYVNVSLDLSSSNRLDLVLAERSELVRVSGSLPGGIPAAPAVGVPLSGGEDGDTPTVTEIESALSRLDQTQFNLLCIPLLHGWDTSVAADVSLWDTAVSLAEHRRAIVIIDPPSDWVTAAQAETGAASLAVTRSENAAMYFPQITAPDPLQESRPRSFPPCGVVAGIIARTDGDRGPWKSAAGLDATINGAEPSLLLRDDNVGALNKLGINTLWMRPLVGAVIWGARTLVGADALASQWKYLAVRRTALYIESSLDEGMAWAVFEPNDEPLWSQVRLSIGAFMQQAFRRGAFQGKSPRQAYLVKCDRETTTQSDQRRGVVNIVVGFAPLKPAEFVIIRLQQLTEQAAQ